MVKGKGYMYRGLYESGPMHRVLVNKSACSIGGYQRGIMVCKGLYRLLSYGGILSDTFGTYLRRWNGSGVAAALGG